MARDLGKYGIRSVAVAPGGFETALIASMDEKAKAKIMKQAERIFPMKRFGYLDEFSHFV